jgi:hypothetical protein
MSKTKRRETLSREFPIPVYFLIMQSYICLYHDTCVPSHEKIPILYLFEKAMRKSKKIS